MAKHPSKKLLGQYETWLLKARKLARSTSAFNVRHISSLASYAEQQDKALIELTTHDIRRFMAIVRSRAPRTAWKLRYPLQSFYDFLSERHGLSENPLDEIEFADPGEPTRHPREFVREQLGKLAPSHRLIALFASELRASGVEFAEIFEIDADIPVPERVEVSSRRHGQRDIPLSDNARAVLTQWRGHLPIGVRAFQRALEKVGLSPKDLGDNAHPGPAARELAKMPSKSLHVRLQQMKNEPTADPPDAGRWPILAEFATWLKDERKLAARTVELYVRHVTSLAAFAAARGKELIDLTQADIGAFVVANRGYAPRTQANLRYPLKHFYKFVSDVYGREDDPTDGVTFTKPPPAERRPRRQIGQRLAKLSTRNRQIALFVSELREAGATVGEIFEIEERVPAATRVRVESGRAGARTIPLSDQARRLLDEWGGRLPIQVRAFQRVLEKVGLSPKDLGDPAHPGLADLHATLLPEATLHRKLEQSARPAFLRGEYDTAILVAMKSVEVAVRNAGGFSPDDIGVALMREAFHITKGPLRDPELVRAEREATSNLFAGAIGLFKNPSSHRDIDLADPFEVAGVIRLADVLLKIVDRARRAQ